MSSQKSDLTSLSSLSSTASCDPQKQNNPPPVLQLPQKVDDPIDRAFWEEKERLAKSCEEFAEEYRKEERIRMKNNLAEARRELLAKYFSEKDIFGDDISEDVKAGRCIGTESYEDPVSYQKLKAAASRAAAEASTGNGEQSMGKKG